MNAVIGFLGSPYSANESAEVLMVQVGVISGSLQTDIVLNLSTTDVTAIGKQLLYDLFEYSSKPNIDSEHRLTHSTCKFASNNITQNNLPYKLLVVSSPGHSQV